MGISSCRIFGVPIDQGMCYFAVIEMFMVLIHLKHLVETILELNFIVMNDSLSMVNHMAYKQNCTNGLLLFIDILKGAFCSCLILQIFFAFVLYFAGYRKKSAPVCMIWILVSSSTIIVSLALLISTLNSTPIRGTEIDPMFWKTQLQICGRHPMYGLTIAVYELYLIFGIWIVFEYIKFIIDGGRRTTRTVVPMVQSVPQIPSVSEKPSENV